MMGHSTTTNKYTTLSTRLSLSPNILQAKKNEILLLLGQVKGKAQWGPARKKVLANRPPPFITHCACNELDSVVLFAEDDSDKETSYFYDTLGESSCPNMKRTSTANVIL